MALVLAAAIVSGCASAPPVTVPSPAPVSSGSTPAATLQPSSAAPSRTVVPAASAVPALALPSVANFRDVAGTGDGLPLAGGGHLALGVVYRSADLQAISSGDREKLTRMGITDIYDLRTTKVARKSPDKAVKGADYHLINLFGVYTTKARTLRTVAAAQAARRQMNRDFVAVAEQRRRTAAVLKAIAAAPGPVIIHCTEGKDRTGWVAAILQLTAGASRDDVMKQYLLSNEYRKQLIDSRYAKTLRTKGKQAAAIQRAGLVVDASYLRAGLDELNRRYRDLDTYLTKGLGLSTVTVQALRARLVA